MASGQASPHVQPASRVKVVLSAAGLVLLAGVVTVAAILEMKASRAVTSEPQTRVAAPEPRPPLTRAEEAYVRALWPIHGEVERSSVRMSLAQISYKTRDMGKVQLKSRVDEALASYRRAEKWLGTLEPPPSLRRSHDEYLAAVRLFQKSAVEARRMFDDGNDDHLRAAYPLGLAGSTKLRALGERFWPEEFPPN